MTEVETPDFPKRHDWEDYHSQNGIEVTRQFVELENDAYWVYRTECKELGIATRGHSLAESMSMLIEHLVEERAGSVGKSDDLDESENGK